MQYKMAANSWEQCGAADLCKSWKKVWSYENGRNEGQHEEDFSDASVEALLDQVDIPDTDQRKLLAVKKNEMGLETLIMKK